MCRTVGMSAPVEPPFRDWTKASIDVLASTFGLPNRLDMQDWAYEVADPTRLTEFSEAINRFNDPDTLFTLLDIIIQSFEDSDVDLATNKDWYDIDKYMNRNFELHAYQIWYWSAFDTNTGDAWRVSPWMRAIWARNSPAL